MSKKLFLFIIFGLIISFSQDQLILAQNHPKISVNEVTHTDFHIFHVGGDQFYGYLVFYDHNGQSCAVSSNQYSPQLKATKYFFAKRLDINHAKFQTINQRSGIATYGYIIEPFHVKKVFGQSKFGYFEFIWDDIRVVTPAIRDYYINLP